MEFDCDNLEEWETSVAKRFENNQLSKEEKKNYIKSGYAKCPKCKDDNIEGGSVEIDANGASQDVICLACGAEWTDIYKLSDIEIN